jgi:hypothetical protein
MQVCTYLNEFPTGRALKDAIRECLAEQAKLNDKLEKLTRELEAEKAESSPDKEKVERLTASIKAIEAVAYRYRIEVDEKNLERLDDGPLVGKLAYQSRDECQTREFNIEIYADPTDSKHYPLIDNEPYRWFSIEGIYARWRQLKERYEVVLVEAVKRLAERGVTDPGEDAPKEQVDDYWNEVGIMMRSLPEEFLPPAEYEWSYSKEKIEKCFSAGFISKTAYNRWKKNASGQERVGAWQCNFCDFAKKCLPMQYPELAYLALQNMDTDEAAL